MPLLDFSKLPDQPAELDVSLLPDKPSFMREVVGKTAVEAGEVVVGGFEAAAATIGGIVEFFNPMPGLAGIVKGIQTGSLAEAEKGVQSVQDAMSPLLRYRPQTRAGAEAQQTIQTLMDFFIGKPARLLGGYAQRGVHAVSGGETEGVIAGTVTQVALELAAFGAIGKGLHTTIKSKITQGQPLTTIERSQMESSLVEVAEQLKRGERTRLVVEEPSVPRELVARKPPVRPPEAPVGLERALRPNAHPEALKVWRMYDRADAELQTLRKPSIREAIRGAKRALVDTSGNIKADLINKAGDLGKEAAIKHDLIYGASTKGRAMVDRASKGIYEGLPKWKEKTLNRMIQSRRTVVIDAYKEGVKHPEGFGGVPHDITLKNIAPELVNELTPRMEKYFETMRQQVELSVEAGLSTRESADAMIAAGDYSPRRFIQYIDPPRTGFDAQGRKITVPDSGIKALKEGSERVLENNSRLLLDQAVTRNVTRIMRNEANQALYQLAIEFPDNGFVTKAKTKKVTLPDGRAIFPFREAPAGHERISVMIEGKQRAMYMPSALAKEWVMRDPAISSQLMNMIGWLSGAKILRPMATGINPAFAMTNFPRDLAHIYLVTSEYSTFLPKAIPQMARDLAATSKDAFLRRGAWHDYIDQGGGMDFLTAQGRLQPGGTGRLETLQKVLGYTNETTEIWARLALRERALRNGASPTEATHVARNYIDFSQGGNIVKALDAGIPYFNAAIQGTRGIGRAAKTNPKAFTAKVAQVGTVAAGLWYANRFVNREAWDQIPDRQKVNNWIFTTPYNWIDKSGNRRWLYVAIAKDQGQRVFASVVENLLAKFHGEDIDVDQLVQAVQDFMPILPTETLPPSMDALLGYVGNKDFWRNEDIWRGFQEIKASQEYTQYTHPAFVKIGEATGLSPERLDYVLQQYFTYSNIYTKAVGAPLKMLLDEMPEEEREKAMGEILTRAPILRRILKSTDPYVPYEEEIRLARIGESTRQKVQRTEVDTLAESYLRTGNEETLKQFQEYLKTQPPRDVRRLEDRFESYEKLRNIPDRRYWLNLRTLSPELRAQSVWKRYKKADAEEKRRLLKQANEVPGISSKRFAEELERLMRGEK